MTDCTDFPTPEDAKRFKNNADSVDEFVTSDSDTFVDQDGGEHLTMTGIRNSYDPPSLGSTQGASLVGTSNNTSVQVELNALQLGQGSGTVGYATQALLFADLNHDDKTVAYVTNDSIAENNGTYRKSGASGSGSWVQSFDDLTNKAYQLATVNESHIFRQGSLQGGSLVMGDPVSGFDDRDRVLDVPSDTSGKIELEVFFSGSGDRVFRVFNKVGDVFTIVKEETLFNLPHGYSKTLLEMTIEAGQYIGVTGGIGNNGLGVNTSQWFSAQSLLGGVGDTFTATSTNGLNGSFNYRVYANTQIENNKDALDSLNVEVSSKATKADISNSYETTNGVTLYKAVDAYGQVYMEVDNKGVMSVIGIDAEVPFVTSANKTYDYELNQVIFYGQSLSIGNGENLRPQQQYSNLMFTKGVFPQVDFPSETPSDWYASLVPLVFGDGMSKKWSKRTVDRIAYYCERFDGLDMTNGQLSFMPTNSGAGGANIASLQKGTAPYNQLLEHMTYAQLRAQELEKVNGVGAICWVQGEADATSTNYKTELQQLCTDLNTDIKATVQGQKDIPMITYQVRPRNSTDNYPTLAFLDLHKNDSRFHLCTPMYHIHKTGAFDPVHLSASGYDWLGEYFALAYKRIVINKEDWSPTMPKEVSTQGGLALVRMNVPTPPLVIDTQYGEGKDYGFVVHDDQGNVVPIISVNIASPTSVKIKIGQDFQVGYKIRYALDVTVALGDGDEIVGNIRDSQGDYYKTVSGQRLDNFCVNFEETI